MAVPNLPRGMRPAAKVNVDPRPQAVPPRIGVLHVWVGTYDNGHEIVLSRDLEFPAEQGLTTRHVLLAHTDRVIAQQYAAVAQQMVTDAKATAGNGPRLMRVDLRTLQEPAAPVAPPGAPRTGSVGGARGATSPA